MTGVTHNHLRPCSARAAGDWLWITPCLIVYREKRTSAALLLLKSCFLSSSKKRTYHLLQNRTFLFAIDTCKLSTINKARCFAVKDMKVLLW